MATSIYSEIMRLAPIRYYPLASATDKSSNAQNGTVNGTVTFGQASLLKASTIAAALFNGTNGYISVPTSGLPTGNSAWSIGCWFQISSNPTTTSRKVVGFGNWGTTRAAPHVGVDTAGKPFVDGYASSVNATAAVSLNAPHLLVGTWDGTTLTLYVDNVTPKTGTPGAFAVTLVNATVGASPQPADYFPGIIAHAFIVGSALTAAQVAWLYDVGLGAGVDMHKSIGKFR